MIIGRFVESRNAPASQAWGLRPSRTGRGEDDNDEQIMYLCDNRTLASLSQGTLPRATRGAYAPRAQGVGPTPLTHRAWSLRPSHVIPEASAATGPKTVRGCLCPLRFSASRMGKIARRMDKTAPGGLRPLRFSRGVELQGAKRMERVCVTLGW